MGTNSGKEKQKKMQCEVTGIGRPLVLVPGGLTGWASWEHGDITVDMRAEFLQQAGFVKQGQSARDLPQWNYWIPFKRSLRINPFVVSHEDYVERLKEFKPPRLLEIFLRVDKKRGFILLAINYFQNRENAENPCELLKK